MIEVHLSDPIEGDVILRIYHFVVCEGTPASLAGPAEPAYVLESSILADAFRNDDKLTPLKEYILNNIIERNLAEIERQLFEQTD